jgi:hypothetical protein
LLVDDVDGSEASESVSFGFDGTTYELDLSEKNARKLREELGPWIKAAELAGLAGLPRPAATWTSRLSGPEPRPTRSS